MKMNLRYTTVTIAVIMFLTCLQPYTVLAGGEMSKGEILDVLLDTAANYNPEIYAGDIVKGYEEGDFRAEKLATDYEMLVMISRAYPDMPIPRGAKKSAMPEKMQITDVPLWTKKHLEYLNTRGIIFAGTVLDDSVTPDELEMYLRRVWRMYGTNYKDDFYAAVNDDYLSTGNIAFGGEDSVFAKITKINDARVSNIIKDIVNKNSALPKEQKIRNVYLSAKEMVYGKGDLSPILPYIEKIDDAESIEQLSEIMTLCSKEIYINGLFGFELGVDLKNTSRYMPVLSVYEPSFSFNEYESDKYKKHFVNYVKGLFMLGGESSDTALKNAEMVYEYEKELSKHCLSEVESSDVRYIYNLITAEQLQEMYSFADIYKIAEACGIELKPKDNIMVCDVGNAYNIASICNEDLQLAKNLMKISIYANLAVYLSADAIRLTEDFEYNCGYGSVYTKSERVENLTKAFAGNYLSEIYCDRFFQKRSRADVQKITDSLIDIYKQKINTLDWMSDETKKKAIKKLDAMTVKIGYSKKNESWRDNAEILPDNTLFENVMAINKALYDETAKVQHSVADKNEWAVSAYTVNAYYSPINNEIVLPAGILQKPFYDPDATFEENMAGIGIIIGHELSHAFDNTGAVYNEKGNVRNWWSAEDYARFEEKCNDISAFYDGFECASNITTNGELTVGECIADLGGVSCVLALLEKRENPNYRLFYTSYARVWRANSAYSYIEHKQNHDPHPNQNVRVNRCVVNFESFFDTFDIKEGDGMYVPPEKRVGLW